jgi:hypothetical protein
MKTSTTTGGRKAPTFTETQATRNRAALARQAQANRDGRLLGLLIVEIVVLAVVVIARCV